MYTVIVAIVWLKKNHIAFIKGIDYMEERKSHGVFQQHEGEYIMTDVLFFGEQSL